MTEKNNIPCLECGRDVGTSQFCPTCNLHKQWARICKKIDNSKKVGA
jgi:hypothetical protein